MLDGSGTAVTLVPDSTITAEFADGSMGGNAGCNSYFAAYAVDGNNITIEQAGSTRMFCEPQELMDQETAYLAALGTVTQFQIENGQLILLDEGGNAVLTYNATEVETPVGLSEATWLLNTMIIGGDAAASVLSGTRLTAVFNTDSTISGSSGCNSFGGPYTTDGNNITIGPLVSTLMACADEAVMGQEAAYLTALQAAATYQITGETLELFAADGTPLLIFNAEPPQTLAGSSWDVISYNNGNQAVVSVIVGTELTAVFGEDGSLTGSAGCNNYTTTFEATETTITIGPAASTRMFCESPEGVMEQEGQYLAALATAATYRIDGDTMEMRTADDALAVMLQKSE
jgi:heat shock protein HslJ